MKFVALISGGKDSIFAIMEATLRQNHTLVCAAYLAPPESVLEMDSYMFQSAGSIVLPVLAEECMGIPLVRRVIRGKSLNTGLLYHRDNVEDENNEKTWTDCTEAVECDEVEDLYMLLRDVVSAYPEVEAVTCGAILSTYQRVRLEHVCSRLGLTPLSYLWRRKSQSELLDDMLASGIHAVLVKVATLGLNARNHLNKSLTAMRGHFTKLESLYQFHVCGEGGEYETIVLDCPLFRKKLVLDCVEIVRDENDDDAGILKILEFHTESKECAVNVLSDKESKKLAWEKSSLSVSQGSNENSSSRTVGISREATCNKEGTENGLFRKYKHTSATACVSFLPHGKLLSGGFLHLSEIMSSECHFASGSHDSEAEAAVQEALSIFSLVRHALARGAMTPRDVCYCHLYLSEMSHFSLINAHYRDFFGTVLPPSRSCIAVGRNALPRRRRVMMDLCAQRGSGLWMRRQGLSLARPQGKSEIANDEVILAKMNCSRCPLRDVLHVQGLSHWAPVCVGPYSQANVIRGSLVLIAGQIGLDPPTMTLCSEGGWERELEQCWTNAAAVLDGLRHGEMGRKGRLTDCLGALVYLTPNVLHRRDSCVSGGSAAATETNNNEREAIIWSRARLICSRALSNNAGIVPGAVDGLTDAGNDPCGGYEDEETRLAIEGTRNGEEENKPNAASSQSQIPILFVVVPELPVGAQCEVELACASSVAVSCLGITTLSSTIETSETDSSCYKVSVRDVTQNRERGAIMWDCGHDLVPALPVEVRDFPLGSASGITEVNVHATTRFVKGCCAKVWVTVRSPSSFSLGATCFLEPEVIIRRMVDCIVRAAYLCSIEKYNTLHFRLYHLRSHDGVRLRDALHLELGRLHVRGGGMTPACTVVPVVSLEGSAIFAAQVILCDLIHAETQMWIHQGRR